MAKNNNIEEVTANVKLPLPNAENDLAFDVERVRQAMQTIDSELHTLRVLIASASGDTSQLESMLKEMSKVVSKEALQANSGLQVNENGKLGLDEDVHRFMIDEIKQFLHPWNRQGWIICDGRVVSNVDTVYPKAWEYFHTDDGKAACVDQATYNNMRNASWGTNGSWGG